MNFTAEQMNKAKQAKTAEELLAFAKESGISLAEEEAKKYFADMHHEGEIAEEELANVAGGCFLFDESRPASVAIKTNGGGEEICPACGGKVTRWQESVAPHKDNYDLHGCTVCGKTYRRYYDGDEWTEN